MRGEYESRLDLIKRKGWGFFPQPFFIIFLLLIPYVFYMLLSF
jgi:hypothetical protein